MATVRFIWIVGVLIAISHPAVSGMIDKDGVQPWEVCALCHSLDGNSRMAKFPKLAGQPAAYIEKQFRDFRDGRRDNDGGPMQAVVNEIKENEIGPVAVWFAKQSAPPPLRVEQTEDARRLAAALFEKGRRGVPACGSCHSAVSKYGAPRLRAQHGAYIAKQLQDFREGRRGNDPDGVMRAVADALTSEEINALASYLASVPRQGARPSAAK